MEIKSFKYGKNYSMINCCLGEGLEVTVNFLNGSYSIEEWLWVKDGEGLSQPILLNCERYLEE